MAAGVVSGPAAASGSQQHSAESGMAWKWILEKLLLDELPVGRSIRFINGSSHFISLPSLVRRNTLTPSLLQCRFFFQRKNPPILTIRTAAASQSAPLFSLFLQ